ncbi:MAG TPA: hydroxymethylbilane synthase [Propionibacteriaceae bacterium]
MAAERRPIRIGARTSPLARAQADLVAGLLAERGVESTFVGVTTAGDVDRRQLTVIGGTGVFVGAVRDALLNESIDVAVHSLKDLPTTPADELEMAAIPVREDIRDVLIGHRLGSLVDGLTIGTGAPRRAVQLEDYAEQRGLHIKVMPIRGNVDTRLGLVRSGQLDAVVLAAAGLKRLGRLARGTQDDVMVTDLPAEVLSTEVMLPAPGQGALALEIRSSLSLELAEAVRSLDDPTTRSECEVERVFLATLEAGCTAPVGARAVVKSVRGTSLDLTLRAVIGKTLQSTVSEPTEAGPPLRVELQRVTTSPSQFGADAARHVLAELDRPSKLSSTEARLTRDREN